MHKNVHQKLLRIPKEEEQMYQVAVVADEEDSRLIKKTIHENFRGSWNFIEVQEQEKLLELVKNNSLDMVFLSLSFSGFSGLRMLKLLREQNKSLHVCVCSEFFSQDIVSEVVLYGVDGYVSTPIRKIQLVPIISKIITEIEEEKIRWIEEKSRENYLRNTRTVLESGFLYSILFGEDNEKHLHSYCDALGVMYNGFMLCVEIVDEDEEVNWKIRNQIIKTVKQYERCVVGSPIFNRIIVYVSWSKEKMRKEHEETYISGIRKKLQKDILKKCNKSVRVGSGKVYSIKKIYHSYQGAVNSLYLNKQDKKNTGIEKENNSARYKEYRNKLSQLQDAVKTGKNESLEIFNHMLEDMRNLERNDRINQILQIIIIVCHTVHLSEENELKFFSFRDFFKDLERIQDVESWAYRKFEYILGIIRENYGRKNSRTINIALDYIDNNYTQEISLENVAKHIGLTPQHFSKIFKQETGSNYVDWITRLRIEKAKQYLSSGEKNIKEICYLVGYKDPNYFSRIFRRIVGTSPSEYIKCEMSIGVHTQV